MLGAAYLDVALEQFIRTLIVAGSSKSLFDYGHPLGAFAGKIEVAFAVGWIPRELRDDLNIIRDIRNDFGHDPNHALSFTDRSVSDRLRKLSVGPRWERFIEEVTAEIQDQERRDEITREMRQGLLATGRKRFELAVSQAFVFFQNKGRGW